MDDVELLTNQQAYKSRSIAKHGRAFLPKLGKVTKVVEEEGCHAMAALAQAPRVLEPQKCVPAYAAVILYE
jgi:hypothetical protein